MQDRCYPWLQLAVRDAYSLPMQRSDTTPDDFLASVPEAIRDDMATLDREISAVMADRQRVLSVLREMVARARALVESG